MSIPTYGEMRTRTEQITDEIVKERVLAGLAFLQQEYGDSWVEEIDCMLLDLSCATECVLGQVEGDFDDALQKYGKDTDWALDHGFYVKARANEVVGWASFDYHGWSILDDAWHTVLCNGIDS